MAQAVIRYADAHPDIVASNKPFQKYVTQLKRQHLAIDAAAKGQDEDATGSHQDKKLARARLCLEASIASGLIYAWAADQENGELEARNAWTQSDLEQLSATRLERACRAILADGKTTFEADPECGLTEEGLRLLETLIGTFAERKEAPRNKTSERSAHTKKLAALMKELTPLLRDKMDKAALAFKKTHPDFYMQYKENRKIMDVARADAAPGHGGGNG